MPGAGQGIHAFLPAGRTWMAGTSPAMTEQMAISITTTRSLDVASVSFHADLSGALFWEEQRLLVVSDLHLEKGSSFAAHGVLLPPYDTVATLSRLAVRNDGQPVVVP